MKKVVLAFSGGLDTSYCAIYLAKEMGLEVHAALANTGGFSAEELARIEKRAYALGVKSYVALDVTQDYYQHAIKYMIFGNVLKNSTYPISVSSERISQATAIARYAREIGADYLCHGSTGAGNDQVRFDMIGIEHVYTNCHHKLKALHELCGIWSMEPDEIMYMGDDVPDLEPMTHVGMPVCPADAAMEVIGISRYVSQFNGGAGCVRDVVEQVMRARGDWYKLGDEPIPVASR